MQALQFNVATRLSIAGVDVLGLRVCPGWRSREIFRLSLEGCQWFPVQSLSVVLLWRCKQAIALIEQPRTRTMSEIEICRSGRSISVVSHRQVTRQKRY